MMMSGFGLEKMSPKERRQQQGGFYYDSNNNAHLDLLCQVQEDIPMQVFLYSDRTKFRPGTDSSYLPSTIEVIQQTRGQTGPIRPDLNDNTPLDLTTGCSSSRALPGERSAATASERNELIDDQTFEMSANAYLLQQQQQRHHHHHQQQQQPTLPLFVNEENALLDAMNSLRRQKKRKNQVQHSNTVLSENLKTEGGHGQQQQLLFRESDEEEEEEKEEEDERTERETGPPWQKNPIALLQMHLEKRHELRPVSRSRDTRSQRTDKKESLFDENSVFQELINGIQQRYNGSHQSLPLQSPPHHHHNHHHRLSVQTNSNLEEKQFVQNGLHSEIRNYEIGNGSLDSTDSLQSTGLSFRRQMVHFAATPPPIQRLDDGFLSSARPSLSAPIAPNSSQSPDCSRGAKRAAVAPPRDRVSPDSRSLPEFESRGTSVAAGQSGLLSLRSASSGGGGGGGGGVLRSAAAQPDGGGGDGGLIRPGKDGNRTMSTASLRQTDTNGEVPESLSPDQSTDSAYKTGNIPRIIASTRLDDDCRFTLSSVIEDKETHSETLSNSSTRTHGRPSAGVQVSLKMAMSTGGPGGGVGDRRTCLEQPSSTFDENPGTKTKANAPTAKPSDSGIPCKICLDVANGFHYGVWSCEGCKAFFKRSITGTARYVCPADNNCTINRLRKKSCQACRLRKCYEFGMSPGNCRGENGSKQGRKRKFQEAHVTRAESEEISKQVNGISVKQSQDQLEGRKTLSPVHPPVDGRLSGGSSAPVQTEDSHQTNGSPLLLLLPPSGRILGHLMNIERPIRYSDCADESPSAAAAAAAASESSSLKIISSLVKLVNAQLQDIVTWSLDLPGFKDVDLDVRTRMLVSCWSEILILTQAFHSLQTPNVFVIAPNLHLTREKCESAGIVSLYYRLMQIVTTLRSLELTNRQMLLLQVIVLINSDYVPQLNDLRSSLLNALNEAPPGASGAGYSDRGTRLLLMLPHLKHCGLQFLGVLSEVQRDSRVPSYGLLRDVIDSWRELDSVSCILQKRSKRDEEPIVLIK